MKNRIFANETENFVPALRSYVARLMVNKYKISEQKTARFLGVSQAAVSKYINRVQSQEIINAEKMINRKEAEKFVINVLSNKKKDARKSVCKLCQFYKKSDCLVLND